MVISFTKSKTAILIPTLKKTKMNFETSSFPRANRITKCAARSLVLLSIIQKTVIFITKWPAKEQMHSFSEAQSEHSCTTKDEAFCENS